MTHLTGGCLCEAIRYVCEAQPLTGGHCYCLDCRRSSGTAYCSHLAVPEPAFRFTGNPARYERRAESGNVVTRAFCGACGSPVYSTNSGMPGAVFVRASSLDDPERFVPELVVYASRAPSWAPLDSALASFSEMPPVSQQPAKLQ
jgi:hypothetical protein